MSFSNYLETKVLDHVFGATAYTAPATLYVALFTTAPGEAGGGTEISGSGYARQSVAFTTTGDTTSNTAAVEFPTASGSWGTISYAAVYDALTSCNQMCYATLASAKTIASGDVFRIPTGDLDITLD